MGHLIYIDVFFQGWAEAEPPCLLELLSGDEGEDEGEDEGDQDRGDDCRTSNTDELAVPGQVS